MEPTGQAISLQPKIQLSTLFPLMYLRNQEPPSLWGQRVYCKQKGRPSRAAGEGKS